MNEGLELLQRIIAQALQGFQLDAIGVSIGGPIEWRTGVVSPLHQPEWRQVPLKEILEKQWRCPVALDIDTNVAALAEYAADATQPNHLLYITWSTGIGQGLCLNGEIYRGGMENVHPEIGHQKLMPREGVVKCDCGANNCLSAFVCGSAIEQRYAKCATELTDEEWREVTRLFGIGIANAVLFYAPDLIALGGGVALGGKELLLKRLREQLKQEVKIISLPRLRFSLLGEEAPLLGAVILAQQAIGNQ